MAASYLQSYEEGKKYQHVDNSQFCITDRKFEYKKDDDDSISNCDCHSTIYHIVGLFEVHTILQIHEN